MGRKKKEVIPPCTHCGITFFAVLRWCPSCEDHMLPEESPLSHDMCNRCARGENDEYLAKKKGRAERIAEAMERQKDPKNWCTCDAVEAYNMWVASPEYAARFDKPRGHL